VLRHLLISLSLSGFALLQSGSPSLWPVSRVRARESASERAEIVLVGDVQGSQALTLVVSELLEREGVAATFTGASHFAPEALLAAPDSDRRVLVFITLPTKLVAKLYLRGPLGQRFLLRELRLRSGLDELGCESIAQVVAASTQVLLRTDAGLDRAAAQAGLREAESPAPPTPPPPEPAPVESRAAPKSVRLGYWLAARGFWGWTGAAMRSRFGGGLELALSERLHKKLLLRQRLVFEQLAKQTLSPQDLTVDVRTSALRLGLDVARTRGPHAFVLGVAAGVDLVHIRPTGARDESWELADAGVDVLPVLRAELRYEWTVKRLLLGCAASADVSLANNHYEVQEGEQRETVARPWPVTPGLSVIVGFAKD
jgi:hypothetical protein